MNNDDIYLSVCPACCHRQPVTRQAVFSGIRVKCSACGNGFVPQANTSAHNARKSPGEQGKGATGLPTGKNSGMVPARDTNTMQAMESIRAKRLSAPPVQSWISIIQRIARSLTLEPEHVLVSSSRIHEETVEVSFGSKGDLRKMLGKQGAHFKVIRALMKLSNRQQGGGLNLDLAFYEPTNQDNADFHPPEMREYWPKEALAQLLADIGAQIFDYPFSVITEDGAGFQSLIELQLKPAHENQSVIDEFNLLVAPLFKAIGHREGRKLVARARPEAFTKAGDPMRLEHQRW